MKFQSALNFWYFCFKTKVQGLKSLLIFLCGHTECGTAYFSSFFERPKKEAKKSFAYDDFATTLISCISRDPSRSGCVAFYKVRGFFVPELPDRLLCPSHMMLRNAL